MKSYNEILSDVTKTAIKIPQSDYLDAGKYRIFDQGKEYSVGFSNDEQGVVTDYPYIIFGDHTRVVKYVDEPCYIGADGVKLLKVINKDFDPRYVYYNILAKPIESQGYARHFKFLKEIQFTEKTLSVQTNIVTELDTIQSAIDNKKQQLSLLDEAVKSEFVEMFGDPTTNPMNWEIKPMGELLSLLTDFSSNGSYKTLDSNVIMYDEPNYALMIRTTDLESGDFSNNVKWVDEKAYNLLSKSKVFGKEIIMNKIGSAGKVYLMPELNRPVTLGRNAFLFRYKESINSVYIYFLLTSEYGQNEIKPYIRGAVTKTITKDDARKIRIPVPPITLQNNFASFVQQIDKSKFVVKQQIADLQELLDYKMNKYFGD